MVPHARDGNNKYRRSPEETNLDVSNGFPCNAGSNAKNIVLLLTDGPKHVKVEHINQASTELLQS